MAQTKKDISTEMSRYTVPLIYSDMIYSDVSSNNAF